jgi:hypothetical protein
MFKVKLYGRVRRAVLVDGVSQRAVASEFGISRKSVRKMVSFSEPPGYRREQPATRPKLDGFVGVIDAILEEDKTRPDKQRHTAKRVFDRLRREHQFTGGYARRNFMVPVPCFATWDAFNADLERQCRKRRERKPRGHTETIAERFERDRAAFLTLPAAPYEACEKVSARVSSLALVRYKNNDYSVPTRHGHLQVLVRGYVHEITIACGSEIIAKHPRS